MPSRPAAKRVLESGKLSRKFFERFDGHKKILTKKRKGAAYLKRVAACSEAVAQQHIDGLAQELISAGIMTNSTDRSGKMGRRHRYQPCLQS